MSITRKAMTSLTLDLSMPNVQTGFTCTLGDRARRLEILVTDGGKPFAIPPTWSAFLSGVKPDQTELVNGCVVEGGRLTYDFESGEQIATCAGRYAVTVWIMDEEGTPVASPKIWVNVIDSGVQTIMNNNSSEDQFGILQELVGNINALFEKDKQVDSDIRDLIRREEIVIPSSTWKDETPLEYSNSVMVPMSGAKTILLYPADDESKAEATRVRLSAEVETGTVQGFDATYTVFRSSGTEAPEIDIKLVAISVTPKEENGSGFSRVIMVGFDTTAEDIDASIKKNAEEIGRLKEKDTQVDEELETLRSKLKNVVSSKVITIDPSQWTDGLPLEASVNIDVPIGAERRSTVLLIPKNEQTRYESQAIELAVKTSWTADQIMVIRVYMTRQNTDPPAIPLSYLALVVYDEEAANDSTATAEFVGVVNLPDELMEREVKRALEALGVTEDLITTMGDVDAVRKDVDQAKTDVAQARLDIMQAKSDIDDMVTIETRQLGLLSWEENGAPITVGQVDNSDVIFVIPADEASKNIASKARLYIEPEPYNTTATGITFYVKHKGARPGLGETVNLALIKLKDKGGVMPKVALIGVDSYGDIIPASIDLSGLDDGKVVETFSDGTTKTTTIEYDADGNPVKITDGDGNVTVLTW